MAAVCANNGSDSIRFQERASSRPTTQAKLLSRRTARGAVLKPSSNLTTTTTTKSLVSRQPKNVGRKEDMTAQLERIAQSGRTAFEKRVWTLLCQVPRGQFTTYGIMSARLASSPRAVGNALRRNPFAPDVPCHRVVATGGALGGFKGKWPRDGEGITLDEKRMLLRSEGVKFDAACAKVLGTPFVGFA